MISRHIEIDEQADVILTGLADEYEGDRGQALAGLLRAWEGMEDFAQQCEQLQQEALLSQRQKSERSFQEQKGIPWQQVKSDNGL
jgi:hypothetical protein